MTSRPWVKELVKESKRSLEERVRSMLSTQTITRTWTEENASICSNKSGKTPVLINEGYCPPGVQLTCRSRCHQGSTRCPLWDSWQILGRFHWDTNLGCGCPNDKMHNKVTWHQTLLMNTDWELLHSDGNTYLQWGHDGVHQLSLQIGSVSQMPLVVVERVVQVRDRAICAHTCNSL